MEKLEKFVYDKEATEDNGQAIFFAFAAEHDSKFPENCNAEEMENTLE